MIETNLRVVIDTNVLLSFLIKQNSIPGQIVSHVLKKHRLILSNSVLQELSDKCKKDKFRRYFTLEEGIQLVTISEQVGENGVVHHTVTDCRDNKDNKFLELALSGNADVIISGDRDLLELHPFHEIPILLPNDGYHFFGLT